MATLPERLLEGARDAIIWTPFVGICGGLGGYVLAKLSDLPAVEAAKHWAVFAIASQALARISLSFFENERVKALVNLTLISLTGGYFITTMRRKELMGDLAMIFVAAVHACAMLYLLGVIFTNEPPEEATT